ncbi:MAG: hypothetical protein WC445_00650 [Patescibacteria group bacterium]
MITKISEIIFLVGVLALVGAGCGNKNSADNREPAESGLTSLCDSAKEMEAPSDLAKELKKIFEEAGGKVKITDSVEQDLANGETFTFVWENTPTAKDLEDAFKKHGYKIEVPGTAMVVSKNDIVLEINLTEEVECSQIIVKKTEGPFDRASRVTINECAEMKALALHADIRNHDFATAMIWGKKLYDRMIVLAAKYGISVEKLETTCEAKVNEPGFDNAVDEWVRLLK